jgi:hypothetical protein
MGIPVKSAPKLWTAGDRALLGTMSDDVLARKLNRPIGGVMERRRIHHILSYGRLEKLWKPWEDRLLGTAPDSKIARRLRRTLIAVSARRWSLKVPLKRRFFNFNTASKQKRRRRPAPAACQAACSLFE